MTKNSKFVQAWFWLLLCYLVLFYFFFLAAKLHLVAYAVLVPVVLGVVIVHLASAIFLDYGLLWFRSMDWRELKDLPPPVVDALTEMCAAHHFTMPSIGVIRDGSLSGFVYGVSKNSARVIFSEGTLQKLDEKELRALTYQLCGKIVMGNFIFITLTNALASVANWLSDFLEQSFRADSANTGSDSDSENKKNLKTLFFAVRVFAWFTTFASLYLSRMQELAADEFSLDKIKDQDAVINMIVKTQFRAFGTSSAKSKKLYALNFRASSFESLFGWERSSIWAYIFEICSPEPRIYRRIENLKNQPADPNFKLDYGTFFSDVFTYFGLLAFPIGLTFLLYFYTRASSGDFLVLFLFLFGTGAALLSLSQVLKIRYGSLAATEKSTVSDLLSLVKVSDMTVVPVSVVGRIAGHSESGSVFDPDFYLEDSTGQIFIEYSKVNVFAQLGFGLSGLDQLRNQEMRIDGWFRRFPVPVIEASQINNGVVNSPAKRMKVYRILGSLLLIVGLGLSISSGKNFVSQPMQVDLQMISKANDPFIQCLMANIQKVHSDFPALLSDALIQSQLKNPKDLELTLPLAGAYHQSQLATVVLHSVESQGWSSEVSFTSTVDSKFLLSLGKETETISFKACEP